MRAWRKTGRSFESRQRKVGRDHRRGLAAELEGHGQRFAAAEAMTARPTPLEPVKSSDETQRERPGVLAVPPEPAGAREIRHPGCGAIT